MTNIFKKRQVQYYPKFLFKYKLENLIRSINPKCIYRDILLGWYSNYSKCCIFYYLIRSFFLNIYVIIFNSYGPFNKSNPTTRHIVCPCCQVKNRLIKHVHEYSYCKKHDWLYYGKGICRLCSHPPKDLSVFGEIIK